ncbi:uncharacterized protein LOC110182391 [Drosophila serrata]|uniref:uncharacterized protein LOC110182391 n=1 Tax=Drosophila serrata TaxID=7274 RepID=UPI000A1D1F66|nr:uncharacterized protein LOC110182391 [Drosophila serrata]
MAGDQLIVSPLNLSFLAPISHFQKRMITMINASDEDVFFRIQIDNDTDYSVSPMKGKVKAFDSTELTVTLEPVIKDIPECFLTVRSIPVKKFANIEEEWNSTIVKMGLNSKIPFLLEDEPIKMYLQSKPNCSKDCSKKSSWLTGVLFALGILGLIMSAYFSFILKSKLIF